MLTAYLKIIVQKDKAKIHLFQVEKYKEKIKQAIENC
jgi:hypothetical protein